MRPGHVSPLFPCTLELDVADGGTHQNVASRTPLAITSRMKIASATR